MNAHPSSSIAPDHIEINPENPRLHFPQEDLEKLSESIDERGILVPLSVYKKPGTRNQYILVDGERRWRCAKQLGLKEVPAIVIPKPNDIDNLLTMFHIHLVREPWDSMPTVAALHKVIERTGTNDPDKLRELTGLSAIKIKQFLFAATLPKGYQQLIDDGTIPLNFFYELQVHALKPLETMRPAIFKKLGQRKILDAFVKKRLANSIPDTVELRQIRQIVKVAQDEAGGAGEKSDLDDAIIQLIQDPEQTIQETYEDTVEMVVEAEKFARQCTQLVERFDRLLKKTADKNERKAVIRSIQKLDVQLQKRIAQFSKEAAA
jgi:ParB family chromosome partitioning protein